MYYLVLILKLSLFGDDRLDSCPLAKLFLVNSVGLVNFDTLFFGHPVQCILVNGPSSLVLFLFLLKLGELDKQLFAQVLVAEKLDGSLINCPSAVDETVSVLKGRIPTKIEKKDNSGFF